MQNTLDKIQKIRKQLGKDLLFLAHHYQKDEIINLADKVGDSLYLSEQAAGSKARFIVFCGVLFMAESAAILAKPKQKVFLPAMEAGCPLSDSITETDFQKVWEGFKKTKIGSILPIAYVNSSAAIKACVGFEGGSVCTSSNAGRVLEWALKQADKVFFMPDQHLGRNTAFNLGLAEKQIYVWDKNKTAEEQKELLKKVKIILWPGFCHVHTLFTVEQIMKFRQKYHKGLVVVHPECKKEVVDYADGVGSTNYIIDFVAKASAGSTVAVGTEIHLVNRLYNQYLGEKTVIPLYRSLCPNMYKINLENLFKTLQNIPDYNQVKVKSSIAKNARKALTRMLSLC